MRYFEIRIMSNIGLSSAIVFVSIKFVVGGTVEAQKFRNDLGSQIWEPGKGFKIFFRVTEICIETKL